MTKTELESKHLAELHALAADAGVPRYRMLPRAELIEKLLEEGPGERSSSAAGGSERSASGQRPKRQRRRRSSGPRKDSPSAARDEAPESEEETEAEAEAPVEASPPAPTTSASAPTTAESTRPKRRRRRRFGRRKDRGVTLPDLLLPPEPGRQAVLYAETREACTALLRGVAADLAGASGGPDPIALLIDPSPEELADWKREAPQAEIVAAGQPRHAGDALTAATNRAGAGEDVILLIDSLTRLGEAYEDAEAAKRFFDSGRAQGATGGGSLTVVAALERSA